jgi:hypothetical protein
MPQKMVRELTVTGPLYLGYARAREVEITFSPELHGQFLMRYETGELSEILHKEAGKELHVSVFPGALWIEMEGQGTPRRQRLELVAGDQVRLRDAAGWQTQPRLGHGEIRIAAKGDELPGVFITREVPRLSTLIDLGYHMVLRPQNASLPMHAGALGILAERGWLAFRLGSDASWSSQQFATWGCTVRRYGGEIGVGAVSDLGRLHVMGTVDGRLTSTRVAYDSGTERREFTLGTGASVAALLPLVRGTAPMFLDVRVGLFAEPIASLAMSSEKKWTLLPLVGLGLAGRAW